MRLRNRTHAAQTIFKAWGAQLARWCLKRAHPTFEQPAKRSLPPNVPGLQAVDTTDPNEQNLPAAHAAHAGWPGNDWFDPGPHCHEGIRTQSEPNPVNLRVHYVSLSLITPHRTAPHHIEAHTTPQTTLHWAKRLAKWRLKPTHPTCEQAALPVAAKLPGPQMAGTLVPIGHE